MNLKDLEIYPVLGLDYSKNDMMVLDLSINNHTIRGLDVIDGLDNYIKNKLISYDKQIAYGGYAEERDFYWSSPLFASVGEKRTIHLGVDLWTTPLTPVYAPLDAIVYGVKYNNLPLDYGYTVVLKHSIDENTFYTLYGHLSDKGIDELEVGQRLNKGSQFCFIGTPTTNGGWAPHLHLQMILDMQGKTDDYPGVATKSDQKLYLSNCPNPELFIFT